jgi:hypothetical protein
MFFQRLVIAVAVLGGQGVIRMDLAAGQSPGVDRRTMATAHEPGPARLSPEAAFIYKCVKMRPRALNWQQIPWLVDLPEAVRQAKDQNRPLLLWLSDDEPLERC